MTDDKLEEYKKAWQERLLKKKNEERKRKEEAVEKAKKASLLLKEKYGINRVILFGSLAKDRFFANSDIDLAIDGTGEEDYISMAWDVWLEVRPFKVDLVPVQEVEDRVKERIEREGVEL